MAHARRNGAVATAASALQAPSPSAGPSAPPETFKRSLLSLPAELRNRIYSYAFADTTISLHAYIIKRTHFNDMFFFRTHSELRRNACLCSAFLGLSRACRQLREETSGLFWDVVEVKIHIASRDSVERMLGRSILPVHRVRNLLVVFEVCGLASRIPGRENYNELGWSALRFRLLQTEEATVAQTSMPWHHRKIYDDAMCDMIDEFARIVGSTLCKGDLKGGLNWELMQMVMNEVTPLLRKR
ncbi:hypothetical protein LTR36_004865 [Oleoguttula mirabilis]|uniref:F-box domain-containing protein n=1 Tax=Oleoguttula mirabilis TaxID=1507867 RepID=A0AAV9JFJ3_9PEZI|nr:hypothetical protein LTR36_004865 [Oleoguttula mirabilis]